ncbi:Glycoside hydrolase family 5 protein [Mycena chlorophos]|uniref:Glycoside hydrolase family 5 protein n=1 Tax=Mycena chlorophos TaxID=658473 RepID=A0A8H6T404_MYCCL|nr:Glycoside hydrolase family 5 protein [Mycena chlorophos]
MKTVVVLGAAYGGARAAQLIAASLPEGWRIVLVDRNSHVNHVYILPRLAVLPGHEHKAFIPCDNIFNVETLDPTRHIFLRATVLSFSSHSVKLSRAFPELGFPSNTLEFDFAVYALGSHLPSPLNLWSASPDGKPCPRPYDGDKSEGIAWLKRKQAVIQAASSVLCVGGGALGIQFASDIAALHPEKRVTLLHSRHRLLPRFDAAMHTEILQELESLGVDVVLGERLDLSTMPSKEGEVLATSHVVRTTTGREISADLVMLCTGQVPNTELLSAFDESTVDADTRLAHVLRTMQLGVLPTPTSPVPESPASPASFVESSEVMQSEAQDEAALLEAALAQIALQDEEQRTLSPTPSMTASESSLEEVDELGSLPDAEPEPTPYPHIFVVGDSADAFGAIPAGHNAYYQAEVAAKNVLKLIASKDAELERYTPGLPAIKVSLGLRKNVYQVNGVVGVGRETRDDLNAAAIWGYFGCPLTLGEGEEDREEMHR